MNRVKRIAHRGWLNKAALVFTFGYYPPSLLVRGKLCIGAITMSLPLMSAAIGIPSLTTTMSLPSMASAMSLPSMITAMSLPSLSIEIEDCP